MSDREQPGGDAAELVVPSTPRSVALIRRYAVQACVALGWEDVADTVALLASEVATNAVLHAYGPEIRVRVLDRATRLRVEVFDSSPVLPVQRSAVAGSEDGRGMALVECLAVQWGVDGLASGKLVWFEVGI